MIHWFQDMGMMGVHAVWDFLCPAKDPYAWISYLSTALALCCYIPQIYRIRKTQSSRDISFWMFGLWIMGSCCWISYGIINDKMAAILHNISNLFFRIWVLAYKTIIDRKN